MALSAQQLARLGHHNRSERLVAAESSSTSRKWISYFDMVHISFGVSARRLEEQSDQGAKQGFTPPPNVLHELEVGQYRGNFS
jgi:hypothetical protein